MLAAPLLRATVRKGTIAPLFCTQKEEFELAQKMIEEFEESNKNHEKKSKLSDRVSLIESSYGDYKLVRGFYALLERRCTFRNLTTGIINRENGGIKNAGKADGVIAETMTRPISTIMNNAVTNDPITIRRVIFEESSKRGFALTDFERDDIIKSVAEKLHIASSDDIVKAMWSDLEDNLIFDEFEPIDARTLLGWYNLSLVQTLLFNSTKMEFYVAGGTNWKRVLRNVKKLGLMYYLEYKAPSSSRQSGDNLPIVCSLEGPLSLFKLTDRYGTSIAKLLPSIIFSSDDWYIDAWVIRKSMFQGKKLYQFRMSRNSGEIPLLMDPFYFKENDSNNITSAKKMTVTRSSSSSFNYFDSLVEEKFSRRFGEVVANVTTGWKLLREPDPLIVSGGKAFIPDFVFEKYGRRVYLEIVGFWTPEYLERKVKKLADIIDTHSTNNNSSFATSNAAVDLFIAINEELATSENVLLSSSGSSSKLFSLIPRDKLILYKNDSVPIRPILDHLKSLDREMLERKVNDANSGIEFDYSKDVVSVREIAEKYDDLPVEVALKLALRDHGDRFIESANGQYLISKAKIKKLESQLAGITKFDEACLLLLKNGIPEVCHADIIANLGYDVLWQSLDPSAALLVRRK